MLSGATGLLGSLLIDVLMEKTINDGLGCSVCAISRSESRMRERFSRYESDGHLFFIRHDIKDSLSECGLGKVDYVLHLASNTHPVQYATDPIGTITTNIIGAQNLMDFALQHGAERFAMASSNEIYGENRGDTESFSESYCGYIDCNTLRAGYPESKRCSESLCQAYIEQKGLNVVIPRFTRSFGPTMLLSDTKALSQFIRNVISGEDIVLKSDGTQYYSYTYAADAVSGLLTVLLRGECGEAYNIADETLDITLRELAETIAGLAGRHVVFKIPDEVESRGFSKATKARLSGDKLKALGWKPHYTIRDGLWRTIEVLRSLDERDRLDK